jgi:hypothetical protein
VLIGYMRISKADGSQTLDLQRDALLAAGVEPGHLYAIIRRDAATGVIVFEQWWKDGEQIPQPDAFSFARLSDQDT